MKPLFACYVLFFLSSSVFAGNESVESDKTLGGDAEVGATLTTGNTKTSSVKAKLDLKHKLGDWENEYIIEGLYKEDDNSVTAKRYQAGAQGNYMFNEDNYVFANGSYEVDEFRGFDYRITAAIGYGHKFFDDEHSFLRAEVGPGYIYDKYTAEQALESGSSKESNMVLHSVVDYQASLSESSKFQQKFIVDLGDRLDVRSESSITAKVIDSLAMKFAVVVRYNNKPLDDIKSTDTETTLTLLYSF
ncbi:DUF481 domain-containing protein [Parashewanella spongiae]|uniref:DUF481 domain-containing protein n=1 Tax=Parashewanella spongiae TaxID=342950 RepID=A0A3A6U0X2_9GAMM|nr:DUF481 domain-containing protein [Parashewanella spongiae]MCL1077392.1 DUF481 domain-containing protein [Parashewanella spongiae]RJY19007.1 DUF481 domain-containing protein [Parashewanella spongiae]